MSTPLSSLLNTLSDKAFKKLTGIYKEHALLINTWRAVKIKIKQKEAEEGLNDSNDETNQGGSR